MEKRNIIIGSYNTATTGLWTLAAYKVTTASQAQNFVEVPGRYAPLDLSTYLTDGEPYYGSASLEATLESSEGDRAARQARIDSMVRTLDGRSWNITPPDYPDHYLVGRVQIFPNYNDPAHCSVQVSAVCEPWMYEATETTVSLTATTAEQTTTLTNKGSKPVVPTIVTTGAVTLEYDDYSWTLSAGTHILPDLCLTPGTHELTYSGTGTITLTYREAVQAA